MPLQARELVSKLQAEKTAAVAECQVCQCLCSLSIAQLTIVIAHAYAHSTQRAKAQLSALRGADSTTDTPTDGKPHVVRVP